MLKFMQATEGLQVLVTVDGIYWTKMDTFRARECFGVSREADRQGQREDKGRDWDL